MNQIPQGFTDPRTMTTNELETAIIAARVHSDTDPGAAAWADLAATELQTRLEVQS